MKRTQKHVGLLLAVAILLCLMPVSTIAARDLTVCLDDKLIEFPDAVPFIDSASGRTLAPIRFIAEALGQKVAWNAVTRTATIGEDGRIRLTIGSSSATVDGKPVALDVAARIKDSRTYVPLRFVSECLDCDVQWNADAWRIMLYTPMEMHFIDVGQADAILVKSRDQCLLIDAGNDGDESLLLQYLAAEGVTELAAAVATHPHEDHIGSLDAVIRNLPVKTLIMPDVTTTTQTFKNVLNAVSAKGMKITVSKPGDEFTLGGATVRILWSGDESAADLNDASVVLRISDSHGSFLMTGDAGESVETALLKSGGLKADVLKVSHHGSSGATSAAFLKAVSPAAAVISVGAGNDYGHPTQTVLTRLSAAGCVIYRTDLNGTVVAKATARGILWETGKTVLPEPSAPQSGLPYVVNTNTGKFHLPGCSSVSKILPQNRKDVVTTRTELIADGYSPCGICKP